MIKYYISGIESQLKIFRKHKPKYLLTSYIYCKSEKKLNDILECCEELLIDSGGHTFIENENKGKGMSLEFYEEFFEKYLQFVKQNHQNPKIVGFFELDIYSVGYEKIKEWRKRLLEVTDKIYIVYHNYISDKEWTMLLKDERLKHFSIGSLGKRLNKNENLKAKEAMDNKKDMHILGCGNEKILASTPCTSSDASSFLARGVYRQDKYVNIEKGRYSKEIMQSTIEMSLIQEIKLQKKLERFY